MTSPTLNTGDRLTPENVHLLKPGDWVRNYNLGEEGPFVGLEGRHSDIRWRHPLKRPRGDWQDKTSPLVLMTVVEIAREDDPGGLGLADYRLRLAFPVVGMGPYLQSLERLVEEDAALAALAQPLPVSRPGWERHEGGAPQPSREEAFATEAVANSGGGVHSEAQMREAMNRPINLDTRPGRTDGGDYPLALLVATKKALFSGGAQDPELEDARAVLDVVFPLAAERALAGFKPRAFPMHEGGAIELFRLLGMGDSAPTAEPLRIIAKWFNDQVTPPTAALAEPDDTSPEAKDEATIIRDMARAHDREESAQKGEPSPWDEERFPERDLDWEQERFLAMREAFDIAKMSLVRSEEEIARIIHPAAFEEDEADDPAIVRNRRKVARDEALALARQIRTLKV